tara:strand:+ start:1472 stop:1618 length:147 start_codon:yes stop_codon:yes gene_type:complete
MKVGNLVKRRNNGDLALVVKVSKNRMKIMRLECGNYQCVWDYEYEEVS